MRPYRIQTIQKMYQRNNGNRNALVRSVQPSGPNFVGIQPGNKLIKQVGPCIPPSED